MGNAFNLNRFLVAQDDVYGSVTEELRAGDKRGHWMWFVFPQVSGLGYSSTAKWYAIASLEEAAAYVVHPVLGARLRECSQLLLSTRGQSAEQILGRTDAQKLRSAMTLFRSVAPEEALFDAVLEKFYAGVPDSATEDILARWRSHSPVDEESADVLES